MSGGIQATAAVGKNNLSDLVFVPFARYSGKDKGVLVALYKDTMEVAWTMPMEHYAWSSPAIFYNSKGDGYLIQADSGGDISCWTRSAPPRTAATSRPRRLSSAIRWWWAAGVIRPSSSSGCHSDC